MWSWADANIAFMNSAILTRILSYVYFIYFFIFLFFNYAALPWLLSYPEAAPPLPLPYGFFLNDLIHCHDFSYYFRAATLQTANLSQLYPFPRFLCITIYLSYITKPEHFQDLTYYLTPSSKPVTSPTFPILENGITVHCCPKTKSSSFFTIFIYKLINSC